MIRELRTIIAICSLAVGIVCYGQDTVDVSINRMVPMSGETIDEFTDRLQATCATNSFPTGVVIRFDNTLCPGPFILSPLFDRSSIGPGVVNSDEILLNTDPYLFNADDTRRWYVHCGTGFKTSSICIDIDAALLPADPALAIPTLSSWGIILLSLIISILFPLTLKKRAVMQLP